MTYRYLHEHMLACKQSYPHVVVVCDSQSRVIVCLQGPNNHNQLVCDCSLTTLCGRPDQQGCKYCRSLFASSATGRTEIPITLAVARFSLVLFGLYFLFQSRTTSEAPVSLLEGLRMAEGDGMEGIGG